VDNLLYSSRRAARRAHQCVLGTDTCSPHGEGGALACQTHGRDMQEGGVTVCNAALRREACGETVYSAAP
jgi:hypothetical protein